MSQVSILQQATALVSHVRSANGSIQTGPFLNVCRQVLSVVDNLGAAFSLVKSDISGNIQRLADRAATNPERYEPNIFAAVQDEVIAATANNSSSCTKGLLWLKRAMQFVVAIVRKTADNPQMTLVDVVSETYRSTLMQYHGFMVSSAFTVAFKFVPARDYFVGHIGNGPEADAAQQMHDFVSAFEPVLQEVHKFLADNGLDDPAKV